MNLMPRNVTLAEALYREIDKNDYLQEIYGDLLYNYSIKLFHTDKRLRDIPVKDALRFADLFSKSSYVPTADRDHLWGQEIAILLRLLYPEDESVKYYLESVLSAVGNYRGLMSKTIKGFRCEDILDTINKQEYVNPKDLLEHFWNMFVVDAFLANFDRHNGNWGFLYNNESNAFEIAPIFDCGSCLLPQADEKIIDKIMYDSNELNSRIFVFPNSIIKINDNKINYYNFLTSTTNQDCKDAVKRIVPRINLEKIYELIDEINDRPTKEKEFYRYYIKARYDMILKPALDFANI